MIYMEDQETPMLRIHRIALAALVAATTSLAYGTDEPATTAVQWAAEEGGNGHWYAVNPTVSPSCWDVDRDMAEAMGGHLATITSDSENSFIAALAGPLYPLSTGTCIGGYQDMDDPEYSEPGGAWKWVTGEPFEYTHWQGGEPGCCNVPAEEQNWLDFNPGNSQWRDRTVC
ncbi:MAG: hypothetical protein VX527_04960, partial [Planctomycetota bacterium]|nr:hypothetical protein [Planctomycetota bacterium]